MRRVGASGNESLRRRSSTVSGWFLRSGAKPRFTRNGKTGTTQGWVTPPGWQSCAVTATDSDARWKLMLTRDDQTGLG